MQWNSTTAIGNSKSKLSYAQMTVFFFLFRMCIVDFFIIHCLSSISVSLNISVLQLTYLKKCIAIMQFSLIIHVFFAKIKYLKPCNAQSGEIRNQNMNIKLFRLRVYQYDIMSMGLYTSRNVIAWSGRNIISYQYVCERDNINTVIRQQELYRLTQAVADNNMLKKHKSI